MAPPSENVARNAELVYAEVGSRLSAVGYSVVELLDRRAGFGWQVGGGGRCVVNSDLRVLLHMGRDVTPAERRPGIPTVCQMRCAGVGGFDGLPP